MRRGERTPLSNADLIAHPVRLRIIMTVAGQQMTTQQIAAVLSDVPQASLYRHIHRLVEGGVLKVVEEIPVRGTVEKVYALPEGAGRIGEAELARASREDHLRYFSVFFASLLSWLRSYLQQETIDPKGDGLACGGVTLHLTDDEYRQLMDELKAVVKSAIDKPPSPERRRRLLATVSIPGWRDP